MKALCIFAISASILCTGCIPFPHTVVRLPAISGRIVESGSPINGAQVLAAKGSLYEPCSATTPLAITDASGAFRIEKKAQLQFLYAPLVAPISVAGLSLCISYGGNTVFADQIMWQPYNSKEIVLECDLASSSTFTDISNQHRARLCHATWNIHQGL